MPGVAKARRDILQVAKEMKAADFLSPNTDPEELMKRAWLDLPGVTDEWIESVEVEKIAGGGDPPTLDPKTLAKLIDSQMSLQQLWLLRRIRTTSCACPQNGHLLCRSSWTPIRREKEMSNLSSQVIERPSIESAIVEEVTGRSGLARGSRRRTRAIRAALIVVLAPPAAGLTALLIHKFVPNQQSAVPTRVYPLLLEFLLARSSFWQRFIGSGGRCGCGPATMARCWPEALSGWVCGT